MGSQFFLQECVLYIDRSRGMPDLRKSLLGQIISERGGILAEAPSKNVTHVLCDEGMALSDVPGELVKSCHVDCKVVKVEWLCHSDKKKGKLPEKEYALADKPEPPAVEKPRGSDRQKEELPTAGYALAHKPDPPVVEKPRDPEKEASTVEKNALADKPEPPAVEKPRDLEKEASTVEKQKSGVKRLWGEGADGNTAEGDAAGGSQTKKPAVASIFLPKAAATAQRYWKHEPTPAGTLIREGEDFVPRKKVAAFDLDSTLIVTKRGNPFPSNENDWKLIQETALKRKLESLTNDGYCIVVISNQAGIPKRLPVEKFQSKINNIQDKLGIPFLFLACYERTEKRKPFPGWWPWLKDHFASKHKVTVDDSESYYCGDAAGRPAGLRPWSGIAIRGRGDFSDSDRKFASNAGIRFYTPEEIFLGSDAEMSPMKGFDPKQELCPLPPNECKELSERGRTHPEMAIMIGFPGSGKTTFAKKYLVGTDCEWINRDSLKSMEKCKALAHKCLSEGRSVVIDNTNPSSEARAGFISIAQQHSVSVRCFLMTATIEASEHCNKIRHVNGYPELIPATAFNTYKQKFQEPQEAEGISTIVKVPPGAVSQAGWDKGLQWRL